MNGNQVSNLNVWVAGVVLAQLYLVFFVYLALSAGRLPERVAAHFGLIGKPNGYMSRTGYLIFIGIFGVLFPLSSLLLYFIGKNDPASLNVPNFRFWFAPERIAATRAYLLAHSLWFSCLGLAFIIGLHYLIVQANRRTPPKLSWPILAVITVGMVAGALLWTHALPRHFGG